MKIKFKIKKIHPGVWLRTGRWKTEKLSEGNKKSGWDLADIQELWLRVSALLFTTLMSFTSPSHIFLVIMASFIWRCFLFIYFIYICIFCHLIYLHKLTETISLTIILFVREEKSGCKTDLSNITKCYCSEDYCNTASSVFQSVTMIVISTAIFTFIM